MKGPTESGASLVPPPSTFLPIVLFNPLAEWVIGCFIPNMRRMSDDFRSCLRDCYGEGLFDPFLKFKIWMDKKPTGRKIGIWRIEKIFIPTDFIVSDS